MTASFSAARRVALQALGLAVGLSAIQPAVAADQWPQKPIRIIVPYPAGGVTDQVIRLMADGMSKDFGQPVVIENRAGAAGALGTDMTAKSPPDGSTFLFAAHSPLTISPHVFKVAYDPMKDLEPVASAMYAPGYLLATTSFKGKTFEDALSLAKKKPNSVSFASPGYGSLGHVLISLIGRDSGAKFLHVPYKGSSGQMISDAAGGQFDMMLRNPSDAINGLIDKGTFRLLAVAGPTRSAGYPSVKTFAELGFKDANVPSRFGFFTAKGTPPEIIQRFHDEVNKTLAQPAVLTALKRVEVVPAISTQAEYAAVIRKEYDDMGKIIRGADIKSE